MRGLKTRGFALSSGAIPVIISFVVWMRQTLKENHLLWEMRKIDIFSHPSTRTTKWSPIRLILVTYQPETSWVISTRAKHKPETLTEGPQTVIVVFAMRNGYGLGKPSKSRYWCDICHEDVRHCNTSHRDAYSWDASFYDACHKGACNKGACFENSSH